MSSKVYIFSIFNESQCLFLYSLIILFLSYMSCFLSYSIWTTLNTEFLFFTYVARRVHTAISAIIINKMIIIPPPISAAYRGFRPNILSSFFCFCGVTEIKHCQSKYTKTTTLYIYIHIYIRGRVRWPFIFQN